jgi:lactoylglutathione lyase
MMSSYVESNANVKQAVPFLMVVNMVNSLDFYIQGLGFELKNKWEPRGHIEWCWLELGNASIMLQEYRDNIPPGIRGEGISIYFICEDAIRIYKEMLSKGLSPSSEPFVGNKSWVVSLKDPDNYNIFFESPTNLPEETTYSQWLNTPESG